MSTKKNLHLLFAMQRTAYAQLSALHVSTTVSTNQVEFKWTNVDNYIYARIYMQCVWRGLHKSMCSITVYTYYAHTTRVYAYTHIVCAKCECPFNTPVNWLVIGPVSPNAQRPAHKPTGCFTSHRAANLI